MSEQIAKTYNYGGTMLCDQEIDMLILRLAESQETFTEDDGRKVLDWANEAKTMLTMLRGVYLGMFRITVSNGEVLFSACPEWKLSKISKNKDLLKTVQQFMDDKA